MRTKRTLVSRIEGNKVSLAFDAPVEVPIVRTEIEIVNTEQGGE